MTNAKKITLILLSSFAILLGLIGVFNIYQNNKTDGLNNGQITVKNCQEVDWSWRIYSCAGDYFSTGGGMVERNNVTVTAFTREYKEGDIIPDVYPPAFGDNETTHHFVTGRERASVTYNLPWLLLVLVAVAIPLITTTMLIMSRNKNHPKS